MLDNSGLNVRIPNMHVFEDLVEELKEEHLLEETVIETENTANDHEQDFDDLPDTGWAAVTTDDVLHDYHDPVVGNVDLEGETNSSNDSAGGASSAVTSNADVSSDESSAAIEAKKGKEFFKKRAVDEVSGLQMVDHVLTGIEREYMKVVPDIFDDFNARKALHRFVQVTKDVNSIEHSTAEFELMEETQAWCSALARRDEKIQVSNLRLFCENSRPALSSQALLALAKFYRNLPYTEAVRGKFDFVVTRLFSRPDERQCRVCLFNRTETLDHLNMLYSEWSSVPLYSADVDESTVMLTALSLEELAAEAENAKRFDQLLENDFFGRLRRFKESINELFFAPEVTAAAIDTNIRVGNAYVRLVENEQQKFGTNSINYKYANTSDEFVSETAGRTIALLNLLQTFSSRDHAANVHHVRRTEPNSKVDENEVEIKNGFLYDLLRQALTLNRWFVAVSLALVIASFGMYVWSDYFAEETITTAGVRAAEVQNLSLTEYIGTARISGDRFYGVVLPAWDMLIKERRQDILQKIYQAGPSKGYAKVNLINREGKLVGYASPTRIEVSTP
jgi:hypothetical protein